jgi:outer membrane PBP1 activator LpoA protein
MFKFDPLAKALRHLLFCVLAIALASCGKSEPAPDPLKAQRNAVQKAKDVNNVIDNAANATRSKIEDAETK